MHPAISQNINAIQSLFKQYGVVSASLFGSTAGDKYTDKSDFDFLIKFNPDLDHDTYANNYFNLLYALQNLLKREVDLVAEETVVNPYFAQSINSNKIALL
jgi:predicted nucleotidyltransferase